MSKWIGLLLWAIALAANAQQACDGSMSAMELPASRVVEGQTLVLAGPAKLQIGLGETASTFAHAPEMLIIKYQSGATLSHRRLEESEIRPDHQSQLAFTDFVRLVFRTDVPDASNADRKEANTVWGAITSGCTNAEYYRFQGTDIFTYSQIRADEERYHAFFILDGDIVHYLDILGSDALASNVLSTLSKRD